MAFFDKIPYMILIAIAVFMLLAPFRPMPHVIEKLIILNNGTLTKPIDIFDLFYHFFSNDYIVIEGLQGLFEIGDDPKSRQPALEKVFNG